jgi:ketosteroid isomerase-like protein
MASASMHVDVEYAEQGGQLTRVSGDVTLFFEKEGGRWVIVRSSGWQNRLDV